MDELLYGQLVDTNNFGLDYGKTDHAYFNFPGPRTYQSRVRWTSCNPRHIGPVRNRLWFLHSNSH